LFSAFAVVLPLAGIGVAQFVGLPDRDVDVPEPPTSGNDPEVRGAREVAVAPG